LGRVRRSRMVTVFIGISMRFRVTIVTFRSLGPQRLRS
jgi:hypothetical protein